ncbi:hypothetical protein [Streptomyces sp. NPDC096311]|uniref:hypothetical protein n=1 Tax=Streptomyces sp. NPDC096311 TaxID=3366083 RepID=UPI0038147079
MKQPSPGNLSTVAADGIDRPFLLIGKDGNDLTAVPSWDALWRHSRGRHRGLSLRGAEHATYTDAEARAPQIARQLGLPRKTVVENIGTIMPRHAMAAERAYLAAFFDRWLRGWDDDCLLDGPSGCCPQARFFCLPGVRRGVESIMAGSSASPGMRREGLPSRRGRGCERRSGGGAG